MTKCIIQDIYTIFNHLKTKVQQENKHEKQSCVQTYHISSILSNNATCTLINTLGSALHCGFPPDQRQLSTAIVTFSGTIRNNQRGLATKYEMLVLNGYARQG